MKTWYVAFARCHLTMMRIVDDRGGAIALACNLLDRGIEVTRVGPLLETEQEIDLSAIRHIWRDRRGASEQSAARLNHSQALETGRQTSS